MKKKYKGLEEEEEDVSGYYIKVRKTLILELERESTISRPAENCLLKRLWTFRKTAFVMMMMVVVVVVVVMMMKTLTFTITASKD